MSSKNLPTFRKTDKTIPDFNDIEIDDLKKVLEREKMLVTSILSFPSNVFYSKKSSFI